MNEPPWLDAPLRTVAALVGDRLPHALLIQGPGGWGGEWVANALAARLLDIDAGREMRAVEKSFDSAPNRTTACRKSMPLAPATPWKPGSRPCCWIS